MHAAQVQPQSLISSKGVLKVIDIFVGKETPLDQRPLLLSK